MMMKFILFRLLTPVCFTLPRQACWWLALDAVSISNTDYKHYLSPHCLAGPQMDEDKRALPVTFPVGCLQLWNGSTQLLHFQRGVYALSQEGIPITVCVPVDCKGKIILCVYGVCSRRFGPDFWNWICLWHEYFFS